MLDLLVAAQLMCAPIQEIDQALRTEYEERTLVSLPGEGNKTLRIYVGEKTWTIILVEGEVGCMLSNGKGKPVFGTPGKEL